MYRYMTRTYRPYGTKGGAVSLWQLDSEGFACFLCLHSEPPPTTTEWSRPFVGNVRREGDAFDGTIEDDFIQNLKGARLFFFFKFEQLHVMTRLNLTTICCILRCLGFIPPSPNTPPHNVSVAYPRSESDLRRGLTSSSLPMLHTSTSFYENDDHHQL